MDIELIQKSFVARDNEYASIRERAAEKIIDALPEQRAGVFLEYIAKLARKLAETAYLNVAGCSEDVIEAVHENTINGLGESVLDSLVLYGISDADFVISAMFSAEDAFHAHFMMLDNMAREGSAHAH